MSTAALETARVPDTVDQAIDEWVQTQLAASPDWGDDKWETLGKILDVEFTPVC
ncbi:hypothetical protein GCM10010218_48290 [Streptomyces mashuensis]|uniref:Uncharacterized protein n=1 Tax=Streptomyces mashuensis TaxID=33904 RepID=A0A919B743_9ACTN|nr:hypothetical protein GCM10010218_48290 [Streptomyces mashuensis]